MILSVALRAVFRTLPPALGLVMCGAAGTTVAAPSTLDDSVSRGAQLYLHHCTACHGQDGRAQMDVISDATDLTDPDAYYSGSSADAIFNSIANGAGVAMPAWRAQLGSDEAIQDLVNYIRSLWPETP